MRAVWQTWRWMGPGRSRELRAEEERMQGGWQEGERA